MNNFILSMLDLPKPRSQLKAEEKSDENSNESHQSLVSSPQHESKTHDFQSPDESLRSRPSHGVITTPIRESLDTKSLVRILSSERSEQHHHHNQSNQVQTPKTSQDELSSNSAIRYLACATVNDQDLSFTPILQPSEEVNILSEHVDTTPSKTIEYTVKFPPGPMGLELEPVIISSERQVGCRVKDYYFREDHTGISRVYLRHTVRIGDIITQIDGETIFSWPFPSIIEKLRHITNEERTIVFRNLSSAVECNEITISREFNVGFKLFTDDLEEDMKHDHESSVVHPRSDEEIDAIQSQRGSSESPASYLRDQFVKGSGMVLGSVLGTHHVPKVSNPFTGVGQSTEKVLLDTVDMIPRYSTTAMERLMHEQKDLLNELAHTSFLLGLTQDREKLLCSQVEAYQQQEYDMKEKYHIHDDEMESYKKTISSLQLEVQIQVQQQGEIRASYQVLYDENQHLMKSYDDMKMMNIKLQQDYDVLLHDHDDMKKEMQQMMINAAHDISQAHDARDHMMTENRSLSHELSELRSKYDALESSSSHHIIQLQDDKLTQEQINIDLMKKLHDDHMMISSYEDEIKRCKASIDDMMQLTSSYHHDLELMTQAKLHLSDDNVSLQEKLHDISSQYHIKDDQLHELQLKLTYDEQQRKKLDDDMMIIEQKYIMLQDDHHKLSSAISSRDDMISSYQHDIELKNHEFISSLSCAEATHDRIRHELHQQIDVKHHEIETLSSSLESYKHENIRLESELKTLSYDYKVSKVDFDEAKSTIASLHQDKHTLLQQSHMIDTTSSQSMMQLQDIIAQKSHDIVTLKVDLSKSQDDKIRLSDELHHMMKMKIDHEMKTNHDIKSLQDKMMIITDENIILSSHNIGLKSSIHDLQIMMKRWISSYRHDVDMMKQQVQVDIMNAMGCCHVDILSYKDKLQASINKAITSSSTIVPSSSSMISSSPSSSINIPSSSMISSSQHDDHQHEVADLSSQLSQATRYDDAMMKLQQLQAEHLHQLSLYDEERQAHHHLKSEYDILMNIKNNIKQQLQHHILSSQANDDDDDDIISSKHDHHESEMMMLQAKLHHLQSSYDTSQSEWENRYHQLEQDRHHIIASHDKHIKEIQDRHHIQYHDMMNKHHDDRQQYMISYDHNIQQLQHQVDEYVLKLDQKQLDYMILQRQYQQLHHDKQLVDDEHMMMMSRDDQWKIKYDRVIHEKETLLHDMKMIQDQLLMNMTSSSSQMMTQQLQHRISELEEEVSSQSSSYESKLQAIQHDHQQALLQLSSPSSISSQHQHHHDDDMKKISSYEAMIHDYDAKILNMTSSYDERLSIAKKQYEDRISSYEAMIDQYDAKSISMTSSHNEALLKALTHHHDQVEKMSSYEAMIHEYKAKISNMTSSYEEALSKHHHDQQEKIPSYDATCMIHDLEAKMNTMKDAHDMEMMKASTQRDDDMKKISSYEAMIHDYEAKIISMTSSYDERLSKQHQDHVDKLSSYEAMIHEYEAKIRTMNMSSSHNESLSQALKHHLDDTKKISSYEAMISDYKVQIHSMASSYDERLSQASSQHEVKISSYEAMIQDYDAKIIMMRQAHDRELMKASEQYQDDMKNISSYEAMIDEYEAKIINMTSSYEDVLSQALSHRQSYEVKLSSYEAKIYEYEAKMNMMTSSHSGSLSQASEHRQSYEDKISSYEAMIHDYEAKIISMTSSYDERLSKQHQDHVDKLSSYEAMIHEYEAKLNMSTSSQSEGQSQESAHHLQKISSYEAMIHEYEARISNITSSYDERLSLATTQHQDDMKKISSYEARIAEYAGKIIMMKEVHDEALSHASTQHHGYEEKISAYEAMIHDYEAKIRMMTASHDEVLSQDSKQHDDDMKKISSYEAMIHDYEAKIISMTSSYDERLSKQHQDHVDKLSSYEAMIHEYEAKLVSMKESHDRELLNTSMKHEEKMSSYEAMIHEYEAKLSNMTSSYDEALIQASQQHHDHSDDVSSYETIISEYKAKMNMMSSSHSEAISQASSYHQEKISSYEAKISDYKAKIIMMNTSYDEALLKASEQHRLQIQKLMDDMNHTITTSSSLHQVEVNKLEAIIDHQRQELSSYHNQPLPPQHDHHRDDDQLQEKQKLEVIISQQYDEISSLQLSLQHYQSQAENMMSVLQAQEAVLEDAVKREDEYDDVKIKYEAIISSLHDEHQEKMIVLHAELDLTRDMLSERQEELDMLTMTIAEMIKNTSSPRRDPSSSMISSSSYMTHAVAEKMYEALDGWHEKVLGYVLDMHEQLTFMFMNSSSSSSSFESIEKALQKVSMQLHRLHEHVLSAPWLLDHTSKIFPMRHHHDYLASKPRILAPPHTIAQGGQALQIIGEASLSLSKHDDMIDGDHASEIITMLNNQLRSCRIQRVVMKAVLKMYRGVVRKYHWMMYNNTSIASTHNHVMKSPYKMDASSDPSHMLDAYMKQHQQDDHQQHDHDDVIVDEEFTIRSPIEYAIMNVTSTPSSMMRASMNSSYVSSDSEGGEDDIWNVSGDSAELTKYYDENMMARWMSQSR